MSMLVVGTWLKMQSVSTIDLPNSVSVENCACVLQEQKSVLIFCGTIARVEQTAREITRFSSEGHLDIQERSTFYNSGASPSKREVFIKRLPKSTPDSLRTCLSHGVGYHHGSAHPACWFLAAHTCPHFI